jgi:GAF domain-containing protein
VSEPARDASLAALASVGQRIDAASRLEPPGGEAVLQSIVEATVAMFGAEAASLALHDPSTDRLVFRVAAGERGQGVIGLSIAPGDGVAGYVFATGSPLAIADVAADPRFGRGAAEQTGYVPRSLLAVPLVDDAGVLGVLEVLDRLDGTSFGLRDIELATVFARQASVAIGATRLERDGARLLRDALVAVAAAAPGSLDDAAIDDLVRAAGAGAAPDGSPVWRIAERLARLQTIDADDADMVVEVLDAVLRRTARRGRRRPPGP